LLEVTEERNGPSGLRDDDDDDDDHAKHLYCAECTNIVRKIVFSVRLKSPKSTDRLRNSVGSEIQTVGPATEKLQIQILDLSLAV